MTNHSSEPGYRTGARFARASDYASPEAIDVTSYADTEPVYVIADSYELNAWRAFGVGLKDGDPSVSALYIHQRHAEQKVEWERKAQIKRAKQYATKFTGLPERHFEHLDDPDYILDYAEIIHNRQVRQYRFRHRVAWAVLLAGASLLWFFIHSVLLVPNMPHTSMLVVNFFLPAAFVLVYTLLMMLVSMTAIEVRYNRMKKRAQAQNQYLSVFDVTSPLPAWLPGYYIWTERDHQALCPIEHIGWRDQEDLR